MIRQGACPSLLAPGFAASRGRLSGQRPPPPVDLFPPCQVLGEQKAAAATKMAARLQVAGERALHRRLPWEAGQVREGEPGAEHPVNGGCATGAAGQQVDL